jgi:hypothetical protein
VARLGTGEEGGGGKGGGRGTRGGLGNELACPRPAPPRLTAMAYDNRYDNDYSDYDHAQPRPFHTTTPPLGPVPLSNSPSTFPPPVPNKNTAYFDGHQASSYATRPASNDLGGYSNHARAKTEGSASEDGMVSHAHADGGGKTRRKSGWRGLSCFSTRNQVRSSWDARESLLMGWRLRW